VRQPRDGIDGGVRAGWSLYERGGFEPCDPFGDYRASPDNTYMTLRL
jgi:hypothetical protein